MKALSWESREYPTQSNRPAQVLRSNARPHGAFANRQVSFDGWKSLRSCCSQTRQSILRWSSNSSKLYDVVALGNLCVDIVVPFSELPPFEEVKRPEMLEKLTRDAASTGPHSGWEAGAQSNFMIAAARLGLRAASAANLGQDVYGDFLRDILEKEGVRKIEALSPGSFEQKIDQTLICFVLVDPAGKHHFCSRYDFGPWPLLPSVDSLSSGVHETLSATHALFVNGFIFDELPGSIVMTAVLAARKAGAAIVFDPGPRASTLWLGERKKFMDALLDASDVVLMTQEEAEVVTGLSDAEQAAASIVERPGAHTEWCVIKLGPQGALIRTKYPPQTLRQSALQVAVADTVGCGDSFAAAIVLGYIQKQPLSTVLALSNAVGAATATSAGAGRNVASADTVRALLSRRASSSIPPGTGLQGKDFDTWVEQIAEEEMSEGVRGPVISTLQAEGNLSSNNEDEAQTALSALRLLKESLEG